MLLLLLVFDTPTYTIFFLVQLLGVEQERHDSFRNLVAQKMSSKLKVASYLHT